MELVDAPTARFLSILSFMSVSFAWGCEPAKKLAGSTPLPEDYAGFAGTIFGYAVSTDSADSADSADPDRSLAISLAISSTSWEFRTGNDWDDAVPVAVYDFVLAEALLVDGVELLPASFEAGASYAGLYGEYADTATRTIAEGGFAGKWIFARNIGPVYVALNGVEYELVTYQNNALDTGI